MPGPLARASGPYYYPSMYTSPEFDAAVAAMDAASRHYTAVTAEYRARRIGDAEWLVARKALDEATAAYDAADVAEAARHAEIEAYGGDVDAEPEAGDPSQFGLL